MTITTILIDICAILYVNRGFPGSSAGKDPTCNAGDPGSIPERGEDPLERDSEKQIHVN